MMHHCATLRKTANNKETLDAKAPHVKRAPTILDLVEFDNSHLRKQLLSQNNDSSTDAANEQDDDSPPHHDVNRQEYSASSHDETAEDEKGHDEVARPPRPLTPNSVLYHAGTKEFFLVKDALKLKHYSRSAQLQLQLQQQQQQPSDCPLDSNQGACDYSEESSSTKESAGVGRARESCSRKKQAIEKSSNNKSSAIRSTRKAADTARVKIIVNQSTLRSSHDDTASRPNSVAKKTTRAVDESGDKDTTTATAGQSIEESVDKGTTATKVGQSSSKKQKGVIKTSLNSNGCASRPRTTRRAAHAACANIVVNDTATRRPNPLAKTRKRVARQTTKSQSPKRRRGLPPRAVEELQENDVVCKAHDQHIGTLRYRELVDKGAADLLATGKHVLSDLCEQIVSTIRGQAGRFVVPADGCFRELKNYEANTKVRRALLETSRLLPGEKGTADVLGGGKVGCRKNPGNVLFQKLVKLHHVDFQRDRMATADIIIQKIYEQNGRFLSSDNQVALTGVAERERVLSAFRSKDFYSKQAEKLGLLL